MTATADCIPRGARPPTALTIAGSDSGGGAGMQADLKTFLTNRVHGLAAVTAVTVQNSFGVSGVHEIPPEIVAAQIASVAGDIGVDASKTGMLASAATVEAIADAVSRVPVGPLVVDPVCASQHGDQLLADDAVGVLTTRLFPLATLITPNLFEVRVLLGAEVTDVAGMREAARRLHDLGPGWVLVKGGHLPGKTAVDVLFDGRAFHEFAAAMRPTAHTHGTGDTLAAAAAASLARGAPVVEAVTAAKAFVTAAVDDAWPLGGGRGPVGHFWRVPE